MTHTEAFDSRSWADALARTTALLFGWLFVALSLSLTGTSSVSSTS